MIPGVTSSNKEWVSCIFQHLNPQMNTQQRLGELKESLASTIFVRCWMLFLKIWTILLKYLRREIMNMNRFGHPVYIYRSLLYRYLGISDCKDRWHATRTLKPTIPGDNSEEGVRPCELWRGTILEPPNWKWSSRLMVWRAGVPRRQKYIIRKVEIITRTSKLTWWDE